MRNLLAQKALFYQIMVLPGDRCAFMETADLMDLVDSVLTFLSADGNQTAEISAAEIKRVQSNDIKS